MPRQNPKNTSDKALTLLIKIGTQIKVFRKEMGISATATAEAAGLSRVTLHRIERGTPSVTMGSYLSVMSVLGLELEIHKKSSKNKNLKASTLTKKITINDYPLLKRLAWPLKGMKKIESAVALELYERNWKHINPNELTTKEHDLIQQLLATAGKERLLV